MQSSNNKYAAQDYDELSRIQKEIDQTTNESLEATRRMLGLVAESDDIGKKTMVMLDEQDNKLTDIEGRLDSTHVGIDTAEKHLTNLQKFGGLFVLPWQRVHRKKHRLNKKGKKSSPTTAEPELHTTSGGGMPTSGFITRITNDDREEEMDDNLQLISSYVGNLKNMALDMGDNIQKQNEKLNRIALKTDAANERVEVANKQTKLILEK